MGVCSLGSPQANAEAHHVAVSGYPFTRLSAIHRAYASANTT